MKHECTAQRSSFSQQNSIAKYGISKVLVRRRSAMYSRSKLSPALRMLVHPPLSLMKNNNGDERVK